MKRMLNTTIIASALALAISSPLMARDVASVSEARQEAARSVASLVNDPAFEEAFRAQMGKDRARLADVLASYTPAKAHAASDTTATLRDLDRQAIHLRGLDGAVGSLLDLHLSGDVGGQPVASTRDIWTATIVKNMASGQRELVAYDPAGAEHRYPANAAPAVPMLMVGSKNREATGAGIRLMNETMRRGGVQSVSPLMTARSASAVEEVTVLTDIYLTDDHEPNTAGDADVFAVVSGVNREGKVELVNVDMPYLDHDKQWYTPGQDLVTWRSFAGNYVNIQLFEDDGDTDWQKIAVTIINTVGDLSLIIAPGDPLTGALSKIAAKVIEAMPGKIWQNSVDYIDSFYLVDRRSHYTQKNPNIGARKQARIGLELRTFGGQSVKDSVDKTGNAGNGGAKGL
ncbi:DUF3103 family protein [Luteibacter sp. NPDC031894]|uniref:DUF3103 family protein n=1 Tax=Luteibacter sp. NPDC031894 TaxID=3390572 RepID=UPI003D05A549